MHKAKAEEAKSVLSNGCPMHAEREGTIPKDVNPNNMVQMNINTSLSYNI